MDLFTVPSPTSSQQSTLRHQLEPKIEVDDQQQQQLPLEPKMEIIDDATTSSTFGGFLLAGGVSGTAAYSQPLSLSPMSAGSAYSPMVVQQQMQPGQSAMPASELDAFQGYHHQQQQHHHQHHLEQPSASSSGVCSPPLSVSSAVSSEATGAGGAVGGNRRGKSREDKVCGVCGDKALGFNFDAVSCESCKAFFRRNAAKGLEALKCPYSGDCQIDVSNRRFCKRCRLRKCFGVGMKKEYILTEEEKSEKRKKIDQNKLIRTLESLGVLPKDLSSTELCERELLPESDAQELAQLLEHYRLSVEVRVPERHGQRAASVEDLINFAELSVMRVIELSKKLPEFRQLSQPDKVALLKGGALELILLRGVISFDPDHARFLDASDSADADSMQGQDFMRAAGPNAGHAFFQLAKNLRASLQCDHCTLVLLLICCLFSPDRPGLSPEGRELVEESQVKYCMLLDRLLRTRFPVPQARKFYPQMLAQLAELRGLEKDFADLANMSNPRFVPPLMTEFLDLQEGSKKAPQSPTQ